MSDESFYGITLTAEKDSVAWEPNSNDDDYQQQQKLIIKQILLGAEAKEGEFNVVEVETIKDSLKIPIAVLKAGETRAVNPDVEFYDTDVKFKLISGNGPVYIHGQTIKDDVMDAELEEEESAIEDDIEEEDPKHKSKKPKLDQAEGKHSKNKRK